MSECVRAMIAMIQKQTELEKKTSYIFSVLLLLLQCVSNRQRRRRYWVIQAGVLITLLRSKGSRSLRHYLRAQSQGHHTTNSQAERNLKRGSASRSSLKGRERAIVNRTHIGIVSKTTLRILLRYEKIPCLT